MAETQPKTTGETSREDVPTPHNLTAGGEPASMFDVQAGAFGNIQDRAKVTPASEDGSLDSPSGLQAQSADVNLTEVNYTTDGTRLHAGVDRGKERAPSIDPYYTSSNDARGVRQQPAAPVNDAHHVSTDQLMRIIKQLTESHHQRSTPITMNPFQNENAPLFTGDNIMDFIETYDSWSREARWTDEDKLTKVHLYSIKDLRWGVESLVKDLDDWEAAKAALVYQYGIADESFYQDPNEELRAIEDEPPLSETDTVGITALFNRIEGLRYKATVRELPEYRDQDLVRLICRRLPKGAIKAAAKALSCDIKDLLRKPWPSVKRAVVKWVAGETSYAYISGRKATKVTAPPSATSIIKPSNLPAQVTHIQRRRSNSKAADSDEVATLQEQMRQMTLDSKDTKEQIRALTASVQKLSANFGQQFESTQNGYVADVNQVSTAQGSYGQRRGASRFMSSTTMNRTQYDMPRIRGCYSCGISGHRAAECDIADESRNAGVAYYLRGWRIGSLADYDIVQDGIINEGRKNSIPDLPTVWAHILRSKAYPQLEAVARQFYNRYYPEQVPRLESSIRHQEAAVAADEARREREEARRQASMAAIDCIDIGYARGHTVDINHIEDEEPVEVNAITRMKNNNFRHTPYGNSSARKVRFADRISTQQGAMPAGGARVEEVIEDEIIVQVPSQPQPQEPARREETGKLRQTTLFQDSEETRSQAAALHGKKRTGNVTLPEQFLLDNWPEYGQLEFQYAAAYVERYQDQAHGSNAVATNPASANTHARVEGQEGSIRELMRQWNKVHGTNQQRPENGNLGSAKDSTDASVGEPRPAGGSYYVDVNMADISTPQGFGPTDIEVLAAEDSWQPQPGIAPRSGRGRVVTARDFVMPHFWVAIRIGHRLAEEQSGIIDTGSTVNVVSEDYVNLNGLRSRVTPTLVTIRGFTDVKTDLQFVGTIMEDVYIGGHCVPDVGFFVSPSGKTSKSLILGSPFIYRTKMGLGYADGWINGNFHCRAAQRPLKYALSFFTDQSTALLPRVIPDLDAFNKIQGSRRIPEEEGN